MRFHVYKGFVPWHHHSVLDRWHGNVGSGVSAPRRKGAKCGRYCAIAIGRSALTAISVERKIKSVKVDGIYRVEFDLRLDDVRWMDSIADALAKMPSRFRAAPCTVILPHMEPLVKWISVPPVERHFLRNTVADAMEVDLPIREDEFAWEFLLSTEGGGEIGGYVFAERRSNIAPLFDLLASEFTYVDGAIVPLMADFSELDRNGKSGKMELQLCIGDTFTTIAFSGGSRPYMRYLSYGWNKLLGVTATESNGLWGSELKNALNSWLLEKKLSVEVEAEVHVRVEKFLDTIVNEITETELQYVHSFSGKHAATARVFSSLAASARMERMLAERLKTNVLAFDRGAIFQSLSASKIANGVDDLTFMRLLWVCGLEMRTPSKLAPFVPEFIVGKRLRERILRKAASALAIAIAALAIGMVGLGGKKFIVGREIRAITLQRKQEETVYSNLHSVDARLAAVKHQFACMEAIRKRQGSWLVIFADLQDAIISTGDAWLTDFRSPGKIGTANALDPITAHISGYMLIKEAGGDTADGVINRMNQLIKNLRACESIAEVTEIVFPPQTGQLQPFQCLLTLKIDKL